MNIHVTKISITWVCTLTGSHRAVCQHPSHKFIPHLTPDCTITNTSTTYFNTESSAYSFTPFSDLTKIIFVNTINSSKKKHNLNYIEGAMRTSK